MHKLMSVATAAAFAIGLAAPAVSAEAATSAPSSVRTTDLRSAIEAHLAASSLSPAQKTQARALAAKLPAGLTLTPRGAAAAASDSEWNTARNGAIDPSQYECADTPVSGWLDGQLANVNMPNLIALNSLGALDIPAYRTLIFGQASKGNRFGYNGEYTNEMNRTMRDLRSFWDIKSDDISLMPMHGAASFTDQKQVSLTLQLAFGVSPATGDAIAALYPMLFAADPALKGGDHPIFTFNAFAYTEDGAPANEQFGTSDRIVMGDGVFAGMAAIGLGRTAPRSILAHEFGHHVQYENNLFDSPLTGPEATRRTELMADGYGSYFMTHKKGQALNKHLVVQDAMAFYNVGDCQFTSDGHHGTPNQRLRAANWASDLALATKPRSNVMPSMDFARAFDAKLPQFVAPDAG